MYLYVSGTVQTYAPAPLTNILSSYQGGGRKGHTTITQATALWTNVLQFDGGPYVVLLDIAKAYPSIPLPLLWDHVSGGCPPPPMIAILRQAYAQTWCFFRAGGKQHSYHRKRGVKEGCPLSPLLVCVVYAIFHRTLSLKFPEVEFFVYMDDIAFASPDRATKERVLAQVSELCSILGFRVNSGKTEIYCWSPDPVNESIVWEGISNKVRPPILQYLGHILAHPNWVHKARPDYMGLI